MRKRRISRTKCIYVLSEEVASLLSLSSFCFPWNDDFFQYPQFLFGFASRGGPRYIFAKHKYYKQYLEREDNEGSFTGGSGIGHGFGCDMVDYHISCYLKITEGYYQKHHEKIS